MTDADVPIAKVMILFEVLSCHLSAAEAATRNSLTGMSNRINGSEDIIVRQFFCPCCSDERVGKYRKHQCVQHLAIVGR